MNDAGGKRCPNCGREYPARQTFCDIDGALLEVAERPDVIGSVLAGHRVLRKLGEGGMGQVYLAEHIRIGRRCALKVMQPDLVSEPQAVARFTREARNASVINHPNVATIYEFGETDAGALYLAMEFVEGRPLSGVLHDDGPLPPLRAAGIVRQAAAALQTAHDLAIVHRDLKPDNIMIAPARDGAERVKLVDFGISKLAREGEQKVTITGVAVGTPAYMSPEQVGGGPVDGASDQFSLACTTFEMLTGALPFAGETGFDQIASRLSGRSRKLHHVRTDVAWPDGLQDVFERALSVRPADRYPTVLAFADAFDCAAGAAARSVEHAPTMLIAPSTSSAAGAKVADGPLLPTHADDPAGVSGRSDRTPPAFWPATRTLTWAAAVLMLAGGGSALVWKRSGAGAERAHQSGPSDTMIARAPASSPAPKADVRRQTLFTRQVSAASSPHIEPTASETAGARRARPHPVDTAPAGLDLARLRTLARGETEQQLNAAIDEGNRMRPRARTAQDSVRIYYYQAQAVTTLGDKATACRLLRLATGVARDLPDGTVARQTAADLGC